MNALDRLEPESALVVRTVLAERGPDLLTALVASDEPTREVREQVVDVLAEEFHDHVSGPDWEPTPWGKRIDDALGWFLHRFPIES